MLKLKLQLYAHLMGRTDSLEKTLMLGKIEGRKRRGRQDEMFGWHDGITKLIREAWNAAAHGVAKRWTRLKGLN